MTMAPFDASGRPAPRRRAPRGCLTLAGVAGRRSSRPAAATTATTRSRPRAAPASRPPSIAAVDRAVGRPVRRRLHRPGGDDHLLDLGRSHGDQEPAGDRRRVPRRQPEDHGQGRRVRLGPLLGQAQERASPAAPHPTSSRWTDRSSPTTRVGDVLLDLKPYIDRDGYDLGQLADQAVADFTTADGQFGLPRDLNVVALYYNKKMFDAAGIPYPDDTWDWAKLVEVAKQLTIQERRRQGRASGASTPRRPTWRTSGLELVWQNGGDIISADKKTNLIGSDAGRRRASSSSRT